MNGGTNRQEDIRQTNRQKKQARIYKTLSTKHEYKLNERRANETIMFDYFPLHLLHRMDSHY